MTDGSFTRCQLVTGPHSCHANCQLFDRFCLQTWGSSVARLFLVLLLPSPPPSLPTAPQHVIPGHFLLTKVRRFLHPSWFWDTQTRPCYTIPIHCSCGWESNHELSALGSRYVAVVLRSSSREIRSPICHGTIRLDERIRCVATCVVIWVPSFWLDSSISFLSV